LTCCRRLGDHRYRPFRVSNRPSTAPSMPSGDAGGVRTASRSATPWTQGRNLAGCWHSRGAAAAQDPAAGPRCWTPLLDPAAGPRRSTPPGPRSWTTAGPRRGTWARLSRHHRLTQPSTPPDRAVTTPGTPPSLPPGPQLVCAHAPTAFPGDPCGPRSCHHGGREYRPTAPRRFRGRDDPRRAGGQRSDRSGHQGTW